MSFVFHPQEFQKPVPRVREVEADITSPVSQVRAVYTWINASKPFNVPIRIESIVDRLFQFVKFISVVHPGTDRDIIRGFARQFFFIKGENVTNIPVNKTPTSKCGTILTCRGS